MQLKRVQPPQKVPVSSKKEKKQPAILQRKLKRLFPFSNWQTQNLRKTTSRYPLWATSHERYRAKALQHIMAQNQHKIAQGFFCPAINHIYDDKGKKQLLEDLLHSKHGIDH